MKFKIGDTAWVARFDSNANIQVPCSICDGHKKVTLILGNGDKVELPCDYCGHGYGPPTGYETEYRPLSKPEAIFICGANINVTSDGEKIEYWVGSESCHSVYQDENVFTTYEEALAKGEELKMKWLKDQQTRADLIKAHVRKSFPWNAGYHLREVKRMEKQIAYHKEKAVLCKERGRGD